MTTASLQLDYVSSTELAMRPAAGWDNVLGVVGFDRAPLIDPARVPVAASMTPSLGDSANLCEVWSVSGVPSVQLSPALETHGRVQFRHGNGLLFGSISVDEALLDLDGSEALQWATQSAYQEIFAVLQSTQYGHLIRVWNYFPEITREADGEERYRHFNSARQTAFRNAGRSTVATVPAACALGSPAGSPLSIYFLASRQAATMIENPRQTSAYHYPAKFGTHSPSFSRACVLSGIAGTNLFVSGTASIVGHETLHLGNVTAQTQETLVNIEALLEEANRVIEAGYSLASLKYKVYVRRPADLGVICDVLSQRLPPSTSIVYLRADVCRENLLVEIEATGESTHT